MNDIQNRARNHQLIVRVTPDEKSLIRKKMDMSGIGNFNAYARKMLIDGYVIHVDLTEFQSLANEVSKVGTNINQVAKVVNATGLVFTSDIDRMKEQVSEIWRLLKSFLSRLISESR